MVFLDRFERRFGWLAFPGFLRFYALLHVLAFALQSVKPEAQEVLEFDRAKILSGEVWRLITFLFYHPAQPGLNPLTYIFIFFMVQIAFMISDGLEGAWGVFRTSLFYYCGIVGLIAANFIYDVYVPGSGLLLYEAAFFAFATLFPKIEFRLYFVLPVQVRYIAILGAVVILLPVFRLPLLLPYFVLAFLNYLLWAGIPALRGGAKVVQSAQRRRSFNKKQMPDSEAFHRCAVCDRTEISDGDLEFRMSENGKEYCEEHLPK